jgi:hypothetical protein
MGVTWLTPSEITPGTADAYTDADVSASVPSGATGVLLHVVNTHATTAFVFGCRKNGSTDARQKAIYQTSHMWVATGVDANRILELYVDDTTSLDVYLVGYFDGSAVFNTNATDISMSTATAWTDVDINVNDGAIAAIVEVYNPTTSLGCGLRKNGSTDNRITNVYRRMDAIVGLDANEIFEGYIGTTAVDFFLTGYIKSGVTMLTNGTDLTPTAAAYYDLTALPSGASGGFIEVSRTNLGYAYALRENGSNEDIYRGVATHCWAFVKCDANRLIEGKYGSAGTTFFLTGHSNGSITYTQNTGAATITPTGVVSKTITFAVSSGGAAVTPTGAMLKMIGKGVGKATLTASGLVNRRISKAAGGATVTPTGVVQDAFFSPKSTGGATVTPVGAITKMVGKMTGKATLTPVGVIVKMIGKGVGKATITPTGTLVRMISKSIGAAVLTPVGVVANAYTRIVAVGGATLTAVGSVVRNKISGDGTIVEGHRINKFLQALKNFFD